MTKKIKPKNKILTVTNYELKLLKSLVQPLMLELERYDRYSGKYWFVFNLSKKLETVEKVKCDDICCKDLKDDK